MCDVTTVPSRPNWTQRDPKILAKVVTQVTAGMIVVVEVVVDTACVILQHAQEVNRGKAARQLFNKRRIQTVAKAADKSSYASKAKLTTVGGEH